ncbi:hypothetical protein M9H77_30926 [Catharanthus roseus]|uniref:Uncharacterized protein n=1 Tax=Catharanthus roseus TaxID=4058 RepID=A0ACB9ZZ00_CATRO|nr:hypothetical protein M9H77_30926 [Catharanthus roseus]
MEYYWSNQSWKRMKAKSKQEDYQSMFTRDMLNFHHGDGNGFKVYGVAKVETLKPSMIKEFSKVNELPQAQEVVEKKQFVEFNSNPCAIPIVDEYNFNIAYYTSRVLEVENEGRSMEKELGTILEELPIKLFSKNNIEKFGILTHQTYSSMSNTIVKIIEACKVVFPEEELGGLYHFRGIAHQWYFPSFELHGRDSTTNLFKGDVDDVDRENQEAKDLLHGPFNSARPKKMKDNDGSLNKFEGLDNEGKASKLLIISSISKDYSGEQFGGENERVL